MSLQQKKGAVGFLFVLPWLIGFIFLFLTPLVESIKFSFTKLSITPGGYSLKFVGWKNFHDALLVDPNFNQTLTGAVDQMLVSVPVILFFSLFVATLLNQKFFGRGFARAIFFLPVILASGAINSAESYNMIQQVMSTTTQTGGQFAHFDVLQSLQLKQMMLDAHMSKGLVAFLTGSVDGIYKIISNSGVQILIFLAGLQSVPISMYEVAKMEGATSYEMFWKITFPMVSPLILTNVIYSIIDSFSNNDLTTEISQMAFSSLNFGLSAAMAWIYCLVIIILLAIIGFVVSRRVFYNE